MGARAIQAMSLSLSKLNHLALYRLTTPGRKVESYWKQAKHFPIFLGGYYKEYIISYKEATLKLIRFIPENLLLPVATLTPLNAKPST